VQSLSEQISICVVYNLWLKATWPTTWQRRTSVQVPMRGSWHGQCRIASHVCSVATYIGALAVEHSRSGLAKPRSCACNEVRFTAARRHVSGLRHLKPGRVLASNGTRTWNLETWNSELGKNVGSPLLVLVLTESD
jgi:hypothetical protein